MKNDHYTEKQYIPSHFMKYLKNFAMFLVAITATVQMASGANYYTRGTGNWSSPTMWATVSGGGPCGCFPGSSDAVFIGDGDVLAVDGNHTVANLTFEDNSVTGTVTVNSGVTLNVTGSIILRSLSPEHKWGLLEGSGVITAGSVSAGHNMTPYTSSQSTALYIQGTLNLVVSNNISIYANENFDITNNAAISLRSGTVTVGGVISMYAEALSTCTFQSAESGQLQTGTLVLAGAAPWSLAGSGTNKITLNGTSATVEYRGSAAQAILGTSYTNLKINAGGNASLGGATTVGGILHMTRGIFLLNGKSFTYGPSASLNYDGTAAQATGEEWPASFGRNISVANNTADGVSLNENKTVLAPATLTVAGKLNFSTHYVDGSGAFALAAGGTIASSYVTNGEGFGVSGDQTKGSVRVGGLRTLSTSGNYILNGAGSFQETGTNMPSTVNSLTVDNAAGVTLSRNMLVDGTLNLAGGLISTGISILTIGASGNVINASGARYVEGRLARVFSTTGSQEFAIGKSSVYRPLTLNFTALSGTSTVMAEQFESAIPGAPAADAILWTERYWSVTESGSSSCIYHVTLDGTGFSPVHSARMIKGDGVTNTAFPVTAPDYTNVTGFTTFSNFALGEANVSTTTTPADQAVCIGATSVTLTAVVSPPPDGGTVQFYINGTPAGLPAAVVGGVATVLYNITFTSLPTYSIRADYSGYGDYLVSSSEPGNNATLSIISGVWTGVAGTSWNDPANWCSGVPTLGTDVIIPAGTPFSPHVTSAEASPAACHDLSILAGATLTIDPGKILTVYGVLTNAAGNPELPVQPEGLKSGLLINASED
jgi:hypothetical protein